MRLTASEQHNAKKYYWDYIVYGTGVLVGFAYLSGRYYYLYDDATWLLTIMALGVAAGLIAAWQGWRIYRKPRTVTAIYAWNGQDHIPWRVRLPDGEHSLWSWWTDAVALTRDYERHE